MQKIVFVREDDTQKINEELASGWIVNSIVTVSEHVSKAGEGFGSVSGDFGAYVILSSINV